MVVEAGREGVRAQLRDVGALHGAGAFESSEFIGTSQPGAWSDRVPRTEKSYRPPGCRRKRLHHESTSATYVTCGAGDSACLRVFQQPGQGPASECTHST